MGHGTHNFDEETLTAERAAEWLSRLEQADTREKESFLKWLRRSPENSGELLVATSTDIVMRQLFRDQRIDVDRFLSSSANVLSVADHSHLQKDPGGRKRWRLFVAAGIGIAATMAAFFITPTLVRSWLHPNEYTTSVGEQRAIELPDGSAIAINAQSSIRVAFSATARDVYLNSGQAMFTVAKDATRPFRVHVAGSDSADSRAAKATSKTTLIQALGTKFDVRRLADGINVAVIEGVVQIRSDARERALDAALAEIGELAKVAAGQSVRIESSGLISPPEPVNLSDVSAWQQRRLVFTDNTLGEITEEFRRYNRTPQIRIEDDELRMQRFSGVFDADYPEALLMYLASDSSIILERNGDDVVIRLRPTVVQSPTDQPAH
jgi:transmembrane sensor